MWQLDLDEGGGGTRGSEKINKTSKKSNYMGTWVRITVPAPPLNSRQFRGPGYVRDFWDLGIQRQNTKAGYKWQNTKANTKEIQMQTQRQNTNAKSKCKIERQNATAEYKGKHKGKCKGKYN